MPRTRYFKNSGKSRPKFQWIGTPLTCSPSRPSHLLFYNSFNFGELTASVGDYILIRNFDSMNQDMLDYEVARLDKLYEDFDNKSDPFRAVITWLCRPNSLPQNMKSLHGMEDEGVSPFNNRHEVVGEAREFAKDISAETIHFKCLVVPVGIHEDPAKFVSSLQKSPYPCYVQRFNMVKKGRKFAMEPVLLENKEGRKALRSRSCSPSSPRVTPLRVNIAQLKLSKRKVSQSEVEENEGNEKRTRETRKGDSPSPNEHSSSQDLPSTPGGRSSTRTPKLRQSMDYSSLIALPERLKTRHKSSPGRVANIVSTERFTKVETNTGSGRKITIRCGDTKKFTPSSGLAGKQILNLLDSDEDDSTVKEKKVSTQLRRTRRASVSCTTPTWMTISTVTPTRVKNIKRPKSEIKKIRANVSSDEEDFQPSNKLFSKLKPKSSKVKAKSTWSSVKKTESRNRKPRDKWNLLWFIPSQVLNYREEVDDGKGGMKKGKRLGYDRFNNLSCKMCRKTFHKHQALEFHKSNEHDGHLNTSILKGRTSLLKYKIPKQSTPAVSSNENKSNMGHVLFSGPAEMNSNHQDVGEFVIDALYVKGDQLNCRAGNVECFETDTVLEMKAHREKYHMLLEQRFAFETWRHLLPERFLKNTNIDQNKGMERLHGDIDVLEKIRNARKDVTEVSHGNVKKTSEDPIRKDFSDYLVKLRSRCFGQ